jgi:hypothetical protein
MNPYQQAYDFVVFMVVCACVIVIMGGCWFAWVKTLQLESWWSHQRGTWATQRALRRATRRAYAGRWGYDPFDWR